MATVCIFALEQTDGGLWGNPTYMPGVTRQVHGDSELLYVDLPVAAQFNHASQLQ